MFKVLVKSSLAAIAVAGLFLLNPSGHAQCVNSSRVIPDFKNRWLVASESVVKKIGPSYFGFNLEWLEFQNGLWGNGKTISLQETVNYLKYFDGAIYRFPGGHNSNHLEWSDSVGDASLRPLRQQVDWMPPVQALFGVDEYLNFVKQVNGRPWYVANLYGGFLAEESVQLRVESARQLAKYIKNKPQNSYPEIFRWELGNELDRSNYKWTPEKYSNAAMLVASAIKSELSNAQFTVMQQEYPAMENAGYAMADYNQAVRSKTRAVTGEYAFHIYYDGAPVQPNLSLMLNNLCGEIKRIEADTSVPASIWITEHARVPPGAWTKSEWKDLWPQSNDMQAAISVSDMMIASTQISQIKGLILHSLHATNGPWPLFHPMPNGRVAPSVVYYAMKMLRMSMLPNVLTTQSFSSNRAKSQGGYDIRAVLMQNDAKTQYSVWAVNRASTEQQVTIINAGLKNVRTSAMMTSLSSKDLLDNNYQVEDKVKPFEKTGNINFDSNGQTLVTLPANSVVVIKMAKL